MGQRTLVGGELAGGWGAGAVSGRGVCRPARSVLSVPGPGLGTGVLTGKDGSGFGQWLFWASRKNQLVEWTSVLLVQLRIGPGP